MNEVIPYDEMCRREGKRKLQKGMNFGLGGNYSIVLMSVRRGAPYNDRIEDNGATLIYEGHNAPKDPSIDQPEFNRGGTPTENGRFHHAAQGYKTGTRQAERVKVYQKIRAGIWSDNGFFHLVNSWTEQSGARHVFKFKLISVEKATTSLTAPSLPGRGRLIPASVKIEVWKRDKGTCQHEDCDATDELHFDHVVPFAKGGTSVVAKNIQLLCARHNLEKSDRIK
jgi:hypothetical protein